MNEKYKQYYNTQNDKNLIERKIPSESDLEKFNELKVLKREQFKNSFLLMSIILLIIVVVGIGLNHLFGIILMLIFALLEFYILKDFLSSYAWKLEYCDYGNVIDKYIKKR